ncbi:AAA-ATPase, partial [Candidatus Magnetomorum sp. HK-1]
MKNNVIPAALPTNQFAFEKIRSKKMIYVDKTQLIYNMISNPDYYFLSRPLRFGKSLLVSVLKHIYLGNRDFFKGLWIDQHTDWEWKEWPILFFDFNSISNGNEKELKQGLHDALEHNLDRYHITLIKTGLKEKFKEALSQLYKATNSKIVILVDEYDKPIIDHLDNEEHIQIAKKNRRVMKEFYG